MTPEEASEIYMSVELGVGKQPTVQVTGFGKN